MKAHLEFNLPEENDLFHIYKNGLNWHSVAEDMRNFLRTEIKRGEYTDEELRLLELVERTFFEIVEDNKVFLQ